MDVPPQCDVVNGNVIIDCPSSSSRLRVIFGDGVRSGLISQGKSFSVQVHFCYEVLGTVPS